MSFHGIILVILVIFTPNHRIILWVDVWESFIQKLVFITAQHLNMFFIRQWCRSQAAQLCHPKVCSRSTDQEWQENYRVCSSRWLPQLHRGEWRSFGGWFRSKGRSIISNRLNPNLIRGDSSIFRAMLWETFLESDLRCVFTPDSNRATLD